MKLNLIYLFTFLFTVNTYAQSPKFELGLNAGINRTIHRFHNKPEVGMGRDLNINSKASYNVGCTFQYNFSKNIALKAGVELALKKVLYTINLDYDFPYEQYRETFTNKYLTFPLCLRVSRGEKLKAFVDAGVYYSQLFSSKSEYNNIIMVGTRPGYYDSKSAGDYYNSDYGLILGTGLAYQLPFCKSTSFSFEVLDYYGLQNISASDRSYKVRNNSLTFLLGLSYGF